MKSKISVLYAEDDSITRFMAIRYLKSVFENIYEAEDGKEGLALYKKHRPDVVVTDLTMPHMNGHDMIKEIQRICPGQKIIVTTGHRDEVLPSENISLVEKPVSLQELADTINNVTGI